MAGTSAGAPPGTGPRETRASAGALIVMVGAPGSGKSFLAWRIAEALGATVVQTDAIRKELFSAPRYTHRETRTVYDVAHQRIEAALARGERVIFDATNLKEENREILYRLADTRGARLAVIVAGAPVGVVRARLMQRQRARDARDLSDADWPVYLRLRRSAEPVGRPHVLANTCVGPGPLLRLLRRLIGDDQPPPRVP